MKQILAIGGGGFTEPDPSYKIEKFLLSLSKKEKPKICFLPQASAEANEYIIKFYDAFLRLGANPSWISLFGRVEDSWREKLLSQDIIYVGGGNTKSMIALWNAWGLDHVLKKAYEKGIILSGISAGAICWFEQGITDSVWPLGVVDGLGLLQGSICPHFDSEVERQVAYKTFVENKRIKPGLALEDETSAYFIDGKLDSIVQSDTNKKAYQIHDDSSLTALDHLIKQL